MSQPRTHRSRRDPVNDKPRIPDAGGPVVTGPTDFVVVFHRLETQLSEFELTELRRWIRSWWRVDRPSYVVMGCCADTSREDRSRRLQGLVGQLVKCGLTREAIRYTDDWVAPPCQSPGTPLPGDVVWLKAVDAASAGRTVMPITDLFLVDRPSSGEGK
jgi:hypothetical protein